jgi:5-methyltetrahydrofolate--homocysteine methyltransferase
MATVKGDVHDIGKNIVGVVLGCNNYEIIDLGVMVPCEKILQTARELNVDMIGLSGLITPSLDEMAHVAREMQREGFSFRCSSAARPRARRTRRSKSRRITGSPSSMCSTPRAPSAWSAIWPARNLKPAFDEKNRQEQEKRASNMPASASNCSPSRKRAAAGQTTNGNRRRSPSRNSPARARWRCRWRNWFRSLIGRRFSTPGNCADATRHLHHEKHGAQARELFEDAQKLLQRIVAKKLLTARGVYGFFPGQFRRRRRGAFRRRLARSKVADGVPFPAPANRKARTASRICAWPISSRQGPPANDYIGAFAVTAGLGVDELAKEFKADHDDYNAIMTEALADRLAEAFAEYLHKRARAEWGYGKTKT